LPLTGLKVIEVAQGVAGPHCGRILAAFGADVIKIEPPSGDWSRHIGPFLGDDQNIESSAIYQYNNSGKRSVVLDLFMPENISKLTDIVSEADVLIEDWDVPTRLLNGIGKDKFTKSNSSLIEISLTPFGLSGPYAHFTSTPIIQLALGGYLYLTGLPDKEPLMLPGYQPDYLTGLNGNNAVQIALWERDQTGVGQFVEIAMMETLTTLHQFTMEMETYEGFIRNRNGNLWQRESGFANYGITTIECRDGHVCFGISTEDQWERLCLMIGKDEFIEDPQYATRSGRRSQASYLDSLLKEWVGEKTRNDVMVEASEIWGLPTAPVLGISEVLEDPQFLHRGLFTEIDHPVSGKAHFPTFPFKTVSMNTELSRSPLLGEHTSEVIGL
jgi:crotonobetainyl-CoA:carnitine CoA-transferase CaiB-like acyl-CoA transferase